MIEEMQGCELCSKEHPLESMTMQEDIWVCEDCCASFQKHFSACDHAWTPHINTHGEPSQYCEKCTGMVRDEDMPLVTA